MKFRVCPFFALLAVGSTAHAQYSFAQIDVDDGNTGDPTRTLTGAPALNNAGQIAYQADIVGNGSALYRYQGGVRTVLADASNGLDFIGRFPSINASGQVGFAARDDDSDSFIFRASGGSIQNISQASDNFDFVDFFPSINASGLVAFRGEQIVGSNFIDGIYVGNGTGAVSSMYKESGLFGSFGSAPSLNDAGKAAFTASTPDFSTSLVAFGNGTTTTIVVDNSNGVYSSFDDKIDLNNEDDLLFEAFLADGSSSLTLFRDGSLTTVADTNGAFSGFNGYALNNMGGLAFVADLDDGTQGLFLGDNQSQPVLSSDDTLFGKDIASFGFFREGLNDQGQFAFYAFFEDGSASLVLANPVPEPASMAALGSGILGLLRRRMKAAKKD